MPSSQFKGYSIIREIPLGGMSQIFVCLDQNQNRVLLRLLMEEYQHHKRIVRQFERGAQVLRALDHPNIVKLLEDGSENGHPYMILEYLEAQTLRQLLRNDQAVLHEDSLTLLRQMADTLHYMHTHDFLHLDFKPENIMVDNQAHVTLIDFDLAYARDGGKAIKIRGMSGTPAYIAPEVLRFSQVDVRTDIFSFGVTAYELLTAQKPFPAAGGPRGGRTESGPPPPPHRFNPKIPPTLSEIILKCLDKQTESRYPSMSLVVKDLKALL